MPNVLSKTIITPRDLEILTALDRMALTVEQLLKLSRTFAVPFGSPSRVRGRLARLRDAGFIRRWRYATADRGTPADYYRLTLAGFRVLHGPEAKPPTKRHFGEIGLARHHHTQSLAEFFTHTLVAAHGSSVRLENYQPENSLRLTTGEQSLYPDGAFQLAASDGSLLNFFLELDAGTERIVSDVSRDSIQRKIAFYERYQDTTEARYRVLFVTTRSQMRVDHVLRAAAHLACNPQRRLIYATSLVKFLSAESPLITACFHDHQGKPVSLLPRSGGAVQPAHNSRLRPMEAALARW